MSNAPMERVDGTVGTNFLKLGAGEAVARLVAFGVAVYLARTLGASVYGVIVLASTVLLYLSVVTDCGVSFLGVRVIASAEAPLEETVRDVLGARLLVGLVAIVLTMAAAFAFLPPEEAAILAAYSLVLLTVALGTRWVHLGLGQAADAALGRIASEIVAAIVVIVVVHGPADLVRVPAAQLAGEAVGALLLLRRLPAAVQRVRLAVRPAVVRKLLRESWPLVTHALLGLAIFNSDLIFLRVFRDTSSVGTYAAAYALISFGLNLGSAYTMSLLPVMTRVREDEARARALHDTSMAQVLIGALPVAVGGSLVAAPLVQLIFGADYAGAAVPLQVLVWSLPVALIRNVSQGALLAFGRQHDMLRSVAWAAGANVILNLVLIPRWGMIGAAISTLATETLRTVLAAHFVSRMGIPMTAPARFIRPAIAVAAMAIVVWLLGGRNVMLVIIAGTFAYAAALVAVGTLRLRRGALPELVP